MISSLDHYLMTIYFYSFFLRGTLKIDGNLFENYFIKNFGNFYLNFLNRKRRKNRWKENLKLGDN